MTARRRLAKPVRLLGCTVLAAATGTIVNAFAVAAMAGRSPLPLLLDPGRYGVAITVTLPAVLLLTTAPVASRRRTRSLLWAIAGLWLLLVPSILAVAVFGSDVPPGMIGLANAAFAVTVLVVLRVGEATTRLG